MDGQRRSLVEWLDDLCVRFIINLPQEELGSAERICFQVEEAQWFYEDFIRPLDPELPSMNLKRFAMVIFQHCPLLSQFSQYHHMAAFDEFLAYKTRVPVRGAIMLNDAMTEVVLVKGWKKGARWSFPRGKINKDESDLDCAVREVYEETGFDLKEAGLVDRETQHKSIEVSMREQHMQLFVFRGVPADADFEPKTRKEISAIEWYKLAELPTLKQQRAQQHGEVQSIEFQQANKFYMVAPFLGPLKQWIKQQRKRDRLGISGATVAAMPTDDENIQDRAVSDVEAIVDRFARGAEEQPLEQSATLTSSGHLDNLLAGLRASSYPEAVPQAPTNRADPADELKRILSIGAPTSPVMHLPPTTTTITDASDSLLAMLRSSSSQAPQIHPSQQTMPQTPFEQLITSPPLPTTPAHHDHAPQSITYNMAQPPQFSIARQTTIPGPPQFSQSPQVVSPPSLSSQPMSIPDQPRGNTSQLLNLFRGAAYEDSFASSFSNMPPKAQSSHLTQQQQQQQQRQQQQYDAKGPVTVPPASRLPPPTLNSHTLSLLNVFKSPSQLPASPVKIKPQSEIGELSGTEMPGISPPTGPSSKSYFAPPQHQTQSNVASNPTNQHRNALLDIFKSSTAPAHDRQLPRPQEPIELATQSSPHPSTQPVEPQWAKPSLGLQTTTLPRPSRSELTSATITGPLHSPNFDYLKIQQHHPLSGKHDPTTLSRDHNIQPVKAAQRPPLDVAELLWPPPAQIAPEITRQVEAPKPISVSMLPRPQLFDNQRAQVTSPNQGNTFDRRGSQPQEQQNALLSLFGSPASASPKNVAAHRPPPSVAAQIQAQSAAVAAATAAARTSHLSHRQTSDGQRLSLKPAPSAISPVSPLPGSTGSPSAMEARSRISSIDSLAGGSVASGLMPVAPTSAFTPLAGLPPALPVPPQMPAELPRSLAGSRTASLAAESRGTGLTTPTTPVDKGALLGFLAGVVKGAKP